jgi:hypothetical protein
MEPSRTARGAEEGRVLNIGSLEAKIIPGTDEEDKIKEKLGSLGFKDARAGALERLECSTGGRARSRKSERICSRLSSRSITDYFSLAIALGAALTALLASVKVPSAQCTMGSPRVRDHDFVASLNRAKSFRHLGCCHKVTSFLPTLLVCAHLGERFYIDHDRNVIENPG